MTVDEQGRTDSAVLKADGKPVSLGKIEKMSKSKNNGVDPEVSIAKYGADTLRLFILFTSPPEKELEWSDSAQEGGHRFIRRVWRLIRGILEDTGSGAPGTPPPTDGVGEDPDTECELRYAMNAAIKKVGSDIGERYNFNTAISAIMEYVNAIYKVRETGGVRATLMREAAEKLVLLLSPFTPHVCEEMWEAFGNKGSVLIEAWPEYDEAALARSMEEIAVQINGKIKGKATVASGLSAQELAEVAVGLPEVKALTEGFIIVKVIGVPGRLVNIVVK